MSNKKISLYFIQYISVVTQGHDTSNYLFTKCTKQLKQMKDQSTKTIIIN